MAFYLIGGRGRLGRAIAAEYAGSELVTLERYIYEDWSRDGAADQVSRYFDQNVGENSTVFVTSGLLDPNFSEEDLLKVNYTLAKNVIDGASKIGTKIITFGTVMEELIKSKNSYVRSKKKLSEYVEKMANNERSIKHIQLHTLYGIDHPSPFMFLGQILLAIKSNQPFEMTSGGQLREYHHLEDEAVAIRLITDSSVSGVVNLSHGQPVLLRAVAESVFDALEKSHLLRLGALPEPAEENYDQIFRANEVVSTVLFREALPNINEYMKNCLASFEKES